MTTKHAALATSLGTYAPRHYLIAAFNDSALATMAYRALLDAGFPDAATALCPGPDFVMSWQDAASHQGFLARLVGLFPSEEHDALEDYLAEARRGASLVAVHLDGHAEVIQARDVLKPLGAFDMRYFGDLTITDLI
jgi:hypothetical protein